MFNAIVVVCAVSFNLEIDQSRCITLHDTWGPYSSKENCEIRIEQMLEFSSDGSIKPYITAMLGYPPYVYSTGSCQQPLGEPV
jgi:hypothetical protein